MPPALQLRRNQIMLGLIFLCLVGSVYVNVFRKASPPPTPAVSVATAPAGGETTPGTTPDAPPGETPEATPDGEKEPDVLRPIQARNPFPGTGRISNLGRNPFSAAAADGAAATPPG